MKKHEKYINMLVEYASQGIQKHRLAAAIVLKNSIIGIGINRKKSHPFQKKFGKNNDCIYFHAEIDAIRDALRVVSPNDLEKSILYICRVKYTDQYKTDLTFGLSQPCEGCRRAIETFGIPIIVYTTNYGTIEQEEINAECK